MKPHGTNIFDYIRKLPAAPCDACPHASLCATRGLACTAYAKYLSRQRGTVQWRGETPTRQIFLDAERDHDPDNTLCAYCRRHGVSYYNMAKRLAMGMTRDEARADIVGRAAA